MKKENDNAWDASIRGINEFVERWAGACPTRLLRDAFRPYGADFIDWDQSEPWHSVAVRRAGRPAGGREVEASFQEMSRRSGELVEGFTGPPRALLGHLSGRDRPAWIHANLESFKLIFEPSRAATRRPWRRWRAGAGVAEVSRRFTKGILTVQIGLVMGYLSRNVLGQFDLGVPKVEGAGKLYIV